MPFFPQSIGRLARTSQSNATRRRRADARRRSKSESVETGFCEWHAINARRRIAMQSASYGEIYADVPTQCLDAPASAKSTLPSAPRKSIPPRNAGALGGWLQQRSGVQTQFWSVPFIGDSLLQVNRNCLGRASNAVEHSLGKGEVVSFNPYRQPHFYWLSSTSSLTQLCNSVRNDPGTCGSGRRGNFDSLPLRSPSLHAAVALGVDFRKLRAQQKYLR
jgi:hypothetical protein